MAEDRIQETITHVTALGDRSPRHPTGTIGHIDAAARLRGAASVQHGEAVSLARPLHRPADDDGGTDVRVRFKDFGPVTVGFDELAVECHGVTKTHLDALCHYGVEGSFYLDTPQERAAADLSVATWASTGISTRGVYADIPAVRGVPWVQPEEPVTGDEIERALTDRGITAQPGDALLAYMGRDRYEAEGLPYPSLAEVGDGVRAGLGPSAGEWIADNQISILCWDFLDACGPRSLPRNVHLLIWTMGLALVDNSALGGAVHEMLTAHDAWEGLLTVSPLPLEEATGSLVNPVLLI
jgi:kynurenine formamidase